MARTISAPTPAGVHLSRDAHGVPHIRAADLRGAYWGMGYCHALDRGLQMCLMRLLGQGRAAECLDGSDEMVEVDVFFRRMNWSGAIDAELAKLDDEARDLCAAYIDGINARLSRKRPFEFALVGYRPEPFTLADVVLTSRMVGYLTLAQSQAEVERLFVEMAQAGVPDAHLAALFPVPADFDRSLLDGLTLGERIVPEAVKWSLGAPRAMASNNWVVAGTRTRSGAPMLANDPHLEVNRLPNVWAEQVIELPDDHAVVFTMPGIPAPLIGRRRDLAWGATYTFMDAVDSWVEDCRDGMRRVGDDWVPFAVRDEVIKRKGGADHAVRFYECEHGTLDGDPTVPGRYLATRWAPSTSGGASLMAARDLFHAGSVSELTEALGRIETAWNWVAAGRDGTVGYQMSGMMPRRTTGWNGFVPAPGWDPAYDWKGMVDPADLPRQMDPTEGFIVTANQDLNHLGATDPINMPMGDYRARRIADLLAARTDHDPQTFAAIHLDVHSLQADAVLDVLLPLVGDRPEAAVLVEWDRRYDLGSRGATAFENVYRALCRHMLGATLGFEVVDHLLDETGVFIDFYQQFDRVLLDPGSPWLDGRDRDEVFRAAFAEGIAAPVVPWGERNRVDLTQIFFGGKLPRWLGFDRGPVPLRGGRATPHQGQVYRSAGRVTSFAPSVRLIVELQAEHSLTAMAGGPSDRRFSRWYASGVKGWQAGEYKRVGPATDVAPRG